MQTSKFDQSILRRILIGLITDDVFCARVSSQWKSPGLFDADWANQIGLWCVLHYRKMHRAPKNSITVLFEEWVENKKPAAVIIEAVSLFLNGLAEESKEVSVSTEHLLDLASQHFNQVRLREELEQAQFELSEGRVSEVKERLRAINHVELGQGSFCEPAKDFSVWYQTIEGDTRRPLITYPGAVGSFFEGSFLRGEFYSFMAPDKTGKSTWLMDLAFRALRGRNNVAFFDTGDSSESEVLVRLGCRITRRPEIGGEIELPTKWDDDGNILVEKVRLPGLDAAEAYNRLRQFGRSKSAFRLTCYPNSTLSVADLDGVLNDWQAAGWVPDVVVIDYADIMAPPKGVDDGLDQIDAMWKHLRRLSQERRCLVVTATQANAAAYTKGENSVLGRQNFSGRKTKLAHVNGMIGINVTDDERSVHSARLNWVVRRKSKGRNRRKWVQVAGCYDVENPIILSK